MKIENLGDGRRTFFYSEGSQAGVSSTVVAMPTKMDKVDIVNNGSGTVTITPNTTPACVVNILPNETLSVIFPYFDYLTVSTGASGGSYRALYSREV